jgi:very-short-patch-repair endonuclease
MQTPSAIPSLLHVELSHTPTLNYAMEQSGVPIVTSARLLNRGDGAIEGAELSIRIAPDIAPLCIHNLPRLRPGEAVDLGVVDVRLQPGRLRAMREAERAVLSWEVSSHGTIHAQGDGAIDVLACNEWPGLRAPPALLATFVTPNEPVIGDVLRRVRDRLRANTGTGAIDGYQLSSPLRVREMVQGLYETVQSLGISYASPPASYERAGQKIRLADAVLADGMGTCLDITVLTASCLEQMGLSPLLVVLDGHAFPGVWLVDQRFPEGVVYDAARCRNATALGHLLFFDSSVTVHDPPLPFELAERTARDGLAGDAKFLCLIDVRMARRDRYRPLCFRDDTIQRSSSSPLAPPVAQGGVPGVPPAPEAASRAPTQQASPPNRTEAPGVAARFKQWRDRLLDLSLRNRLVNFRRDAKSTLELTVPNIAKFEDLLAGDKAFDIDPKVARDERDERIPKLQAPRIDETTLREALIGDLDKGIVHCPYEESRMLKHALHLERESRLALEEGGANVLYAAIGFLRWYESDSSSTERQAPLLLVPIALEYARATRRVRIRRLAEDSIPNFTLVEKLKTDFGLDLGALAAIEPDDSGLDVPAMLRGVRDAIQRMDRWEVLEEAHLGLFSFTKFLMWKDLADNEAALCENEVVKHIASSATDAFPDKGVHVPPERLDDEVPAAVLPLVVDADSTQSAAVLSALRGRSFVLQGPPGTGKSQTITNLIAAALAHGKTVLFVSEKMAALEVVYRRLQSVGLGDFCLELHSHKAQKRAVVQQLGRTLERAQRTPTPAWKQRSEELVQARARLNAYVRTLHAPRPLGFSFYTANARLVALRQAPEIRLSVANASALTAEQLNRAKVLAEELGATGAQVEPVAEHPFRASAVEEWSAQGDQAVRDGLGGTLQALDALRSAINLFGRELGIDARKGLAEIEQFARIARTCAEAATPLAWQDDATWVHLRDEALRWVDANDDHLMRRADLARRWADTLFESDLLELEAKFTRWATAFVLLAWLFLFAARRQLRRHAVALFPGNRQIASDLTTASRVKTDELALAQVLRGLRRAFEGCWSGDSTEELRAVVARGDALVTLRRAGPNGPEVERIFHFSAPEVAADRRRTVTTAATALLDALSAYRARVDAVQRNLGLDPSSWPADGAELLDSVEASLRRWAAEMGAFRAWCLYKRDCARMRAAGLGPIVDAHRSGELTASLITTATERAILDAWTIAVRDAEAVLREFDGRRHDRHVEQFRVMDDHHIALGKAHVAAAIEARLPQPGDPASRSSEPGILRREMEKKARHLALRKLLQQIPNLLVRLKPCLLMSPLSVAQYLPARARRFDLVVFDEASQICTHDAIGAIARGNQVVVVGDSKQLPPTTFFQTAVGEDAPVNENDVVELESILNEALAVGLPQQMLGWHYRSRHEALIDFSNQRYYDHRLHVFPAARGRVPDLGVKFHLVSDGVFESGKSRTNPREAAALVEGLIQALRTTSVGERTYGVVTFNHAQEELIEGMLNEARARYPDIETHFGDDHPKHERVFVKNLENVQGDERDEIFFSIAYARDEHGRLLHNFGPLNRDGGERRLNVAVTRARMQLRVFASMTHDHIDLSRTQARGARDLKAFLRFAADQSAVAMHGTDEPAGDFDSDFERDVYDALRKAGHRVHTQVGCGGYRIDLAVVHPDQPGVYVLGIECDGAAYHSGATARDRDRLRQAVLEGLGWRLHRVWSTDWIYDRSRELQRLEAAIERVRLDGPARAVATSNPEPSVPPLPPPKRVTDSAALVPAVPPRRAEVGARAAATYRRARLPIVSDSPAAMYDPARRGQVRTLLQEVLQLEAPIHVDELSRRVAAAFGAARLTNRVRAFIDEALRGLPGFVRHDDFLWRHDVHRDAFDTVRVVAPGDEPREPEVLPPEEIAAAAHAVLSSAFSLPHAELLRETARAFGIQRLSSKVEERMRIGVEMLVRRGLCVEEDGRAVWKGPATQA